jgi:hypothetical protein
MIVSPRQAIMLMTFVLGCSDDPEPPIDRQEELGADFRNTERALEQHPGAPDRSCDDLLLRIVTTQEGWAVLWGKDPTGAPVNDELELAPFTVELRATARTSDAGTVYEIDPRQQSMFATGNLIELRDGVYYSYALSRIELPAAGGMRLDFASPDVQYPHESPARRGEFSLDCDRPAAGPQ